MTPTKLGCDAAVAGITPTQARKDEGAIFSSTTATFAQSLLVRRSDYESGRIVGYKSFAGTKMIIVVVPGTTGETFAWLRGKEVGLPGSVFRQYPGENELLLALKSGEIDAIARGEIGNRYRQGLNHSVLTIDLRDFGEDFAMSIDPTNVDLQKHLAEALKLATKDGALDFRQWSDNPSIFSDWYVANTTGGVPQSFL